MTKINLNALARDVTLDEGLKINLSIGQVKEVQRRTFIRLAAMPPESVEGILKRYRKKGINR